MTQTTPPPAVDMSLARKVLSIVDRGLCFGLGEPIPGQMCIEAAVCYALGLPHDDDPKCVDPALREFVIALNDSPWSSPKARAAGMRKLAIAQLGSLGQIDSIKFAQKLAEQTIRRMLPPILRQIGWDGVAKRCEQEGTEEAAESAAYVAANSTWAAAEVANVAVNVYDAANAARAASNAAGYDAARAARAAANAARAAARAAAGYDAANVARDGVLTLMCDICIDVLRDMGAPGIALMDQVC